jgi:hypothetical protein
MQMYFFQLAVEVCQKRLHRSVFAHGNLSFRLPLGPQPHLALCWGFSGWFAHFNAHAYIFARNL